MRIFFKSNSKVFLEMLNPDGRSFKKLKKECREGSDKEFIKLEIENGNDHWTIDGKFSRYGIQ